MCVHTAVSLELIYLCFLHVSLSSLAKNPNLLQLNLSGCAAFSAPALAGMLKACSRSAAQSFHPAIHFVVSLFILCLSHLLMLWFLSLQYRSAELIMVQL